MFCCKLCDVCSSWVAESEPSGVQVVAAEQQPPINAAFHAHQLWLPYLLVVDYLMAYFSFSAKWFSASFICEPPTAEWSKIFVFSKLKLLLNPFPSALKKTRPNIEILHDLTGLTSYRWYGVDCRFSAPLTRTHCSFFALSDARQALVLSCVGKLTTSYLQLMVGKASTISGRQLARKSEDDFGDSRYTFKMSHMRLLRRIFIYQQRLPQSWLAFVSSTDVLVEYQSYALGLHGLKCKQSSGQHQRHFEFSRIIQATLSSS